MGGEQSMGELRFGLGWVGGGFLLNFSHVMSCLYSIGFVLLIGGEGGGC